MDEPLDEFLEQRGITLDAVGEALAARLGGRPEPAYVAGSAVEGLANATSDLDAFVVRDATVGAAVERLVLEVSGTAVDVEVWPRREVERLLGRLAELGADEPRRDPRRALELAPDEVAFLHRLRLGTPVAEAEAIASLQLRVDASSFARVLFDRAAALVPAYANDLAGLLTERDHDTVLASGQRLLGYALDAFLAVCGDTNPAEKWRLRRLRRLLGGGGAPAVEPPLDAFVVYERFRDLYLLVAAQADPVAYAHTVARIARHIVPWGQRLLTGDGAARLARQRRPAPAAAPHAKANGHVLPRLSIEARLVSRGETTTLVRPAVAELDLGDVAVAALAHFDGETEARVAAARIGAALPVEARELEEALIDLEAVLRARGLLDCVEPLQEGPELLPL